MGTTTNFSLPYPEMSDPPNGPGAFQNLAVAVDTALHGIPSNPISQTLLDAKGDLVVASAPDIATRLPVGTNGQLLTADSTQTAGVKWAAAPSGGFTDIDWQVFTSSGTWTKPTGAVKVYVRMVGGGGGGRATTTGSLGAAGGAGAYAEKVFAASGLAATVSVTVGAGGTRGAANDGGGQTAGGNSVFSTVTAGGGGTPADTVNGALGGTATGGDLNAGGAIGGSSTTTAVGGASVFGGVVRFPGDATGYGSGGSGGNSTNVSGNGFAGVVIVLTYVSV